MAPRKKSDLGLSDSGPPQFGERVFPDLAAATPEKSRAGQRALNIIIACLFKKQKAGGKVLLASGF